MSRGLQSKSDVDIVTNSIAESDVLLSSDIDRSKSILEESLKLAEHHCESVFRDRTQWRVLRSKLLLRLAEIAERKQEIDDALTLISKAHSTLIAEAPKDMVLPITVTFGRLLMTRGIMDRALELFHEARSLAIVSENNLMLGVIDGNIATIIFNTRHYEEAEPWFEKAAATFRSNSEFAKQAHAIRGAGMTLSKRGLYLEALAMYDEALAVIDQAGLHDAKERISIEESIGVDQLNLADTTGHQKHFKQALKHFQNALDLAVQHSDEIHRAVAMRNIAQVFAEEEYKQHDLTSAQTLFESALEIASSANVRLLQAQILRQLSSVYEKLGRHADALKAHRQFYECEREVISEQADSQLRTLEIRTAVERSEAEVLAQQQRALELEQELEQQRKRVTSTSLAIGHKNAALRESRQKLRELLQDTLPPITGRLHAVITQLEVAEQNEEYWDGLEEQLSAIHRNALQNLAHLHPALTPTERRVCALIRHDLSTKDIARLLSTEPRTVEKYRQRIRKKLGLKDSDNLNNYLSTL